MRRREQSSLQKRRSKLSLRKRMTLSLPADALSEAARIAHARNVNVNTVIGEALSEGLRMQTVAERSNEVLERYKQAFSGFSDSEMEILNGVILQATTRK
jgi:hypothetical protein